MKRYLYLCENLLALGICLNACLAPAFAQTLPAGIDITVEEGEGAVNKTRQHVSRDPVVRVDDDDHHPVAGAVVVFALPVSGASGEFSNGSRSLTIVTDRRGLAIARGLKTNDVPGKLQIYVTASFRGQRAHAFINQTIEGEPGAKPPTTEVKTSKSSNTWKWVLLGVAAAGGAGAGIYFHNHTSTTTATPSVSISAGSVVFGNPR